MTIRPAFLRIVCDHQTDASQTMSHFISLNLLPSLEIEHTGKFQTLKSENQTILSYYLIRPRPESYTAIEGKQLALSEQIKESYVLVCLLLLIVTL